MTDTETRLDYHHLVRREVVPLVTSDGGTLLDIGGGVGATAAHLKSLGKADRAGVVDLVDGSSVTDLDFRYSGSVEDGVLLKTVAADEGPFDTILMLDVLEHLVDPWKVVAEAHRMLKPGGILVASIPNIRHYTAALPLFFRNRWQLADAGILDRTHLRFFVRNTAIDLVTHSGLKLEDVRGNPGGGGKVRLFRKATFGALNSFTDLQYLIRARRDD